MEVYYVIYTEDTDSGPCYLTNYREDDDYDDGRMIQSGLYDSNKFEDRTTAIAACISATFAFDNKRKFSVIPVDKRIFGPKPRFVVKMT